MIQKILVANRGEIALRVVRAARELGIRTVAVFSEADRESLHVRLADEAVCIGPAPSSASYLYIPRIISAAEVTACDAIHPGYGFLSENAHFAEICESCNIRFIGPTSEMIRTMGDKAVARKTAVEAGVPVTPGSEGILQTPEEAVETAKTLGYPVIIKAAAGGGGKGMRVAYDEASLRNGVLTAQAEAEANFGSGQVYLERYVEKPRHIEFQVIGDRHGNVIHLGERECSIQRRHQKLIEESPSVALTPALREAMGNAAVRAAKAIRYESTGTIEFLLAPNGEFYFMEMNTRIQVEHPVTEEVTKLDLIKAQIAVAGGEPLPWTQADITFQGHAIECRINAESAEKNFRPSPGLVKYFHAPGGPGVRVDSHLYSGYTVPSHYDSMVAKIICWGRDRDESIARMRRALLEIVVDGIETTVPFHRRILEDPGFLKGDIHTGYLESWLQGDGAPAPG
ncbi:MAG TPA: acetyl-CoA carboxylase biotin carboxylase subunit [Candidatus Eisenbacteria bacterium]|nr:acetyl-CoA carboxylase biotin carboxylase subunit [Candidatus Eisenbacteria bacterium]